jgi:hypothetical protein
MGRIPELLSALALGTSFAVINCTQSSNKVIAVYAIVPAPIGSLLCPLVVGGDFAEPFILVSFT